MGRFKLYKSQVDEYYESIPDGRCKPCKYGRVVTGVDGFMMLGCHCEPYRGKWVAEIKDCPIGMKSEKVERVSEQNE